MPERDPICGMTVDPKKAAASGVYEGRTVYFCSVACKKSYDQRTGRAPA